MVPLHFTTPKKWWWWWFLLGKTPWVCCHRNPPRHKTPGVWTSAGLVKSWWLEGLVFSMNYYRWLAGKSPFFNRRYIFKPVDFPASYVGLPEWYILIYIVGCCVSKFNSLETFFENQHWIISLQIRGNFHIFRKVQKLIPTEGRQPGRLRLCSQQHLGGWSSTPATWLQGSKSARVFLGLFFLVKKGRIANHQSPAFPIN